MAKIKNKMTQKNHVECNCGHYRWQHAQPILGDVSEPCQKENCRCRDFVGRTENECN